MGVRTAKRSHSGSAAPHAALALAPMVLPHARPPAPPPAPFAYRCVGEKRKLVIPSGKGYGASAAQGPRISLRRLRRNARARVASHLAPLPPSPPSLCSQVIAAARPRFLVRLISRCSESIAATARAAARVHT